jgi:hypothetical protein
MHPKANQLECLLKINAPHVNEMGFVDNSEEVACTKDRRCSDDAPIFAAEMLGVHKYDLPFRKFFDLNREIDPVPMRSG